MAHMAISCNNLYCYRFGTALLQPLFFLNCILLVSCSLVAGTFGLAFSESGFGKMFFCFPTANFFPWNSVELGVLGGWGPDKWWLE